MRFVLLRIHDLTLPNQAKSQCLSLSTVVKENGKFVGKSANNNMVKENKNHLGFNSVVQHGVLSQKKKKVSLSHAMFKLHSYFDLKP